MSGRGLSWYKRDPVDFLNGVQGMGPDVIGAYSVILDLIYSRGGETERDDRHLSGILGCSIRKARALTDAILETGKLELQDGFITNSRAKSECFSARNRRETKVKHGRMGGEKSGEVRRNKALAKATASSEAEQIREDKIREEYRESYDSLNQPKPDRGPSFSEFWNVWPLKKQAKQKASAAWGRLNAEDRRKAIAAVGIWCETWRHNNPTLSDIHPTSWINGKRWEDEIRKDAKGQGNGKSTETGGEWAERIARERAARRMDSGTDQNAVVPLLPAGRSAGRGGRGHE